jgi:hypothetical protein
VRRAAASEEPVAGFLQALGDGTVLEPPLADTGLVTRRDLLARRRVDHVVVISGELLMQTFKDLSKQVPVLVNRASLHRYAVPDRRDGVLEPRGTVDDEELWPPQATFINVLESRRVKLRCSPPMVLTASSTFWPSARTPMTSSEMEVAWRSSPHANDRAVKNEPDDRFIGQRLRVPRIPVGLHLALNPARRVLGEAAGPVPLEDFEARPNNPRQSGQSHSRAYH